MWETLRWCLSSLCFTFFSFVLKYALIFFDKIYSHALFAQAAEAANQYFFSPGLMRGEKGEAGMGVERRRGSSEDWCFGYRFIKTWVAWPFSAVLAVFYYAQIKVCLSLCYLKKKNGCLINREPASRKTSVGNHCKNRGTCRTTSFDLQFPRCATGSQRPDCGWGVTWKLLGILLTIHFLIQNHVFFWGGENVPEGWRTLQKIFHRRAESKGNR